MKKLFTLAVAFLLATTATIAQNLKFGADGKFKIAQFTDIHYNGSKASKAALKVLENVLTQERPDLIVLTGDIIYGTPAKENLLDVLNCISKYNIPFVYEFGNHDSEQGLTNRELYNIARGVKNNILPDLSNAKELDYVVKIKERKGKNDAAVLYCLDSHSYPKGFPEDKSHGTYAWLIFHIALPEFTYATENQNVAMIGTRREQCCGPEFNSGMFTAMMEGEDVMGIFVGHDHDNDYTTLYHNIVLGYGRYSGGNTEYNHLKAGARIFVLEEGQRRFSTYIREWDGNVVNQSVYPDSYVADDWSARPLQKYE